MREGRASHGDIEIYTVAEGPVDAPTVVLVNGAGSTAVMWCRELVEPLLAAGFCVIRYDNRDVGRSSVLPSSVGYRLGDMGDDLLAVLDHWNVSKANALGRSMGGAIVMEAALARPDRFDTLTLVYTSACLGDPGAAGLPGPHDWVIEVLSQSAFSPPPANAEERVALRVAETELFAGTRYPFDAGWAREEAEADVAHGPHAEAGHYGAVAVSPSLADRVATLAHPALVLHGDADPIVPVEHGRHLASLLPKARLHEYEGLGHEMPPAFCGEITPVLLAHLDGGPR